MTTKCPILMAAKAEWQRAMGEYMAQNKCAVSVAKSAVARARPGLVRAMRAAANPDKSI